jgi:hypothetical protein
MDPLSPSTLGGGVITEADGDLWAYESYLRYEAELNALAAQRELLQGGIDALARQGLRPEAYFPAPSGNPSRASQLLRW